MRSATRRTNTFARSLARRTSPKQMPCTVDPAELGVAERDSACSVSDGPVTARLSFSSDVLQYPLVDVSAAAFSMYIWGRRCREPAVCGLDERRPRARAFLSSLTAPYVATLPVAFELMPRRYPSGIADSRSLTQNSTPTRRRTSSSTRSIRRAEVYLVPIYEPTPRKPLEPPFSNLPPSTAEDVRRVAGANSPKRLSLGGRRSFDLQYLGDGRSLPAPRANSNPASAGSDSLGAGRGGNASTGRRQGSIARPPALGLRIHLDLPPRNSALT